MGENKGEGDILAAPVKEVGQDMVGKELWEEIHRRFRAGEWKKRIARELQLDPKTVRRVLKRSEWAPYRTAGRRSLLEPHREWVDRLMPEVGFNAACIFSRLKLMRSYVGSYATVRDYVARHRRERDLAEQATVRFETEPGKQAQVDWGSSFTWIGGRRLRVHFFVLTLGFSRRLFTRGFLSEAQVELMMAHEAAFRWFGGVTQEILYDNPRTIVWKARTRECSGIIHPLFLDFARYWGFSPKLCQAYRARTKGKVESGVKYVKYNFLPGRRFDSLDDLNRQLEEWMMVVADVRIHGTTFERPMDRFAREKLFPIDARLSYAPEKLLTRRVSLDSMVSVAGCRYSVPWELAGKIVDVRQRTDEIFIFHQASQVAVHPRAQGPHEVRIDRDHFNGLFKRPRINDLPLPLVSDTPLPDVMVRDLALYEEVAHA